MLLVMHAELVFTLIESDRELATSEIIVKTNSVYHGSERTLLFTYVVHATLRFLHRAVRQLGSVSFVPYCFRNTATIFSLR